MSRKCSVCAEEEKRIEPNSLKSAMEELHNTIQAGDALAKASHRVQSEYDGVHRLRLALSNWYLVRGNENKRGENHEVKRSDDRKKRRSSS